MCLHVFILICVFFLFFLSDLWFIVMFSLLHVRLLRALIKINQSINQRLGLSCTSILVHLHCLQINFSVRIVSNTRKYDRGLRQFRQHELHWLDVVDRVRFRVCVQVYKCLHNTAPGYLSALCQPVSGVPGRRHPCESVHVRGLALAYAGPTSWNSLPDNFKNVNLSLQSFKRHLKTFFFSSY